MKKSPADWTNLFLPDGARSSPTVDHEVAIEDDEVDEVTADMLSPCDDLDDFEDVTDSLEPLDEEEESQAGDSGAWPRSFEDHLSAIRRASKDEDARMAMQVFGLGDVQGCEESAAAVAKTWEDLEFWEPMLEMGRRGEFTGHLDDLRKCVELLERHSPPQERADLRERWQQAHDNIRQCLPAGEVKVIPRVALITPSSGSADSPVERWEQAMAQHRRLSSGDDG